ncbi:uncharacterized protein LOC121714307 [Alosa sapidissima]|uniref:uncharacterized protein LOC121714307 n=1 Tax=Alosa sapidissima TaxID=34773 RepID=UPI001C098FD4|nr:uncharacterized protein LOC121714307 [Alosa sapidissima]
MWMLHTFYFVCLIALSEELPDKSTISFVRLENKSVISEEQTFEEKILINGTSVTPNDNGDGRATEIYRTLLGNISSSSLRDALLIFANRFNNTENHTYQRFRECKFIGHQLIHVSEQIMHNGKEFLSLDQTTDTWTALDPQALSLKEVLDRDSERTVQDRMRFQETCAELLKELTHSDSASKVSTAVLAPLLAGLVFLGLVLLSFIMSKHSVKGSAQPAGGIVGSIVHYPPATSDIVREPTLKPSLSIKAHLLSNMP